MSASDRIRLQQIIREAEGYLELSMLFADEFDTALARKLVVPRALDALKRADTSGGYRAHALYLQGEALRALERYREAIRPLKKAAQLDSSNVHVWLALGWCHKRTGRLDLAIEALEQALEVVEETSAFARYRGIVNYNLACYWSLAGHKDNALASLAAAFEADPDYRDMVGGEPDFDPLRTDPDFQALTSLIA